MEINPVEFCDHYDAILHPQSIQAYFLPPQREYFKGLAEEIAANHPKSKNPEVWDTWLIGKIATYKVIGVISDLVFCQIDDAINGRSGGYDLAGLLKGNLKAIIKPTKADPMVYQFKAGSKIITESDLMIFPHVTYDMENRTQVYVRGWAYTKDVLSLCEPQGDGKLLLFWFLGLCRIPEGEHYPKLKDIHKLAMGDV